MFINDNRTFTIGSTNERHVPSEILGIQRRAGQNVLLVGINGIIPIPVKSILEMRLAMFLTKEKSHIFHNDIIITIETTREQIVRSKRSLTNWVLSSTTTIGIIAAFNPGGAVPVLTRIKLSSGS